MSAPAPTRAGLLARLFGAGDRLADRCPEDVIDVICARAGREVDAALTGEVERLMAIHEDHPDHERLLGGGLGRVGDVARSARDLEHILRVAAAGTGAGLHARTAHLLKRAIGHTNARLSELDETTDEHAQERARLTRLRAWRSGAAPILDETVRARLRECIGQETRRRARLLEPELARCAEVGDLDRRRRLVALAAGADPREGG